MDRRDRLSKLREQAATLYGQQMLDLWYDQVPQLYRRHDWSLDVVDLWEGRLAQGSGRTLTRFLANPTKFLLLTGTEGLGKSTLACTLVSELVTRYNWSSLYASAPIMLSNFSYRPDGGDPISEAIRPNILMLDDVGAAREKVTDFQRQSVWAVVNERAARSGKVTIVTSNMAIESTDDGVGLREWFGTTAWARIQADVTWVKFGGTSFRS